MLKKLTSVLEYMDFINEINSDPDFSDPMLGTGEQMRSNLLDAPDKPADHIWGIYENGEMTGLFVFLVLEEENYEKDSFIGAGRRHGHVSGCLW